MKGTDPNHPIGRRKVLGAAAALSMGVLGSVTALGQTREQVAKGEGNGSATDIGPKNKPLEKLQPNSYVPPDTDRGDVTPIWYSFDLVHRRIQDGGWTRQITQRELPSSQDLAGVTMRLTAGSYRELHWHDVNEWAYMLSGNARVTVFEPNGKIFLGDVSEGDLWFFPTAHSHSIQGLGPPAVAGHYIQNSGNDDLIFLTLFKCGEFAEFSLNQWLRHLPVPMTEQHLRLSRTAIARIPDRSMNMIPR